MFAAVVEVVLRFLNSPCGLFGYLDATVSCLPLRDQRLGKTGRPPPRARFPARLGAHFGSQSGRKEIDVLEWPRPSLRATSLAAGLWLRPFSMRGVPRPAASCQQGNRLHRGRPAGSGTYHRLPWHRSYMRDCRRDRLEKARQHAETELPTPTTQRLPPIKRRASSWPT